MNTFVDKLNSGEYISNKLYREALNSQQVPISFDLNKYNNEVLNKMLIKYKDYFDNMFKGIDDNIHLDEEQIKAILSEEDYSLIIAGAGTGKTTTMAAKVKYLVDIKKVDPQKILVMSYTKKATLELKNRIVGEFHIPACVITFHSLGLRYLKNIFSKQNCSVVDDSDRTYIFNEYIKEIFSDKEKIKKILTLFDDTKIYMGFKDFFVNNYYKYETYEEFYKNYKEHYIVLAKQEGIEEVIKKRIWKRVYSENPSTIKGELVKSAGEAVIANFLFTHGIEYSYEKIYPHLIKDTYKPDFTLSLFGENVYLEYFGLDDEDYNQKRIWKEDLHKYSNNNFISVNRNSLKNIEKELEYKLKDMGFVFKLKTDEEILNALLDSNPLYYMKKFKDFVYDSIDAIKGSVNRDNYSFIINDYINSLDKNEQVEAREEFDFINDFYLYYQKKLYGSKNYRFDFADLIYYANKYIENVDSSELKFDYIIVDEYQDISRDRYELTKNTANKNKSKLFAVGDDWQSIYAFNGSRIDYIYNFNKYFNDAKLFKISKTFRNSQELIDYSGSFIMKNDSQIQKELISNKHISNPIVFVLYDSEKALNYDGKLYRGYQEYQVLKKVIMKIHNDNPNHNILILGRTNAIIDKCYKDKDFRDDIDSKIVFVRNEEIIINGMTIHGSKGLTFDEVIIIGLNERFPIEGRNEYWLKNLFTSKKLDEGIPFAEERRLFYVALTRTKNHVYLIAPKDANKRSEFVDEIAKIVKDKSELLV